MPTVFTHALIPVAAGKIVAENKMPRRFWILGIVCSVLADSDCWIAEIENKEKECGRLEMF